MKPLPRIIISLIITIFFSSCQIAGRKVEVVNPRKADGTYKPTKEVLNAAGESPDAYGTIYHYPSGDIGVSAWYGGLVTKKAPNLLMQ